LSLQEEDPTTGLSTVAEAKPGQIPTTNISENAEKQIYRITNTSPETKRFKYTPGFSASPRPEGSKAERWACFLNDVNVMTDHSDVVIKARSTGLRWDLR
jgi:hypothetical protein